MKLAKLHEGPEIFHTIQGEGKNLGKPSIFLRTSLCNLHCIWCDTDYTWNWAGTRFEHENNKKYSKENFLIELGVEEAIAHIRGFNCRHMVLTGGEPLLQQAELSELMVALKSMDEYTFEVETNGTLLPNKIFDQLIGQYNVSPKLGNSNNSENLRLKHGPLSFYANSSKANFKFVISTEDDLTEVTQIIDRYHILPDKIYLMPEGRSEKELGKKRTWLVDICKKRNFNFTDRLHIHLYGNKRGT